jgi:hypothetical protein
VTAVHPPRLQLESPSVRVVHRRRDAWLKRAAVVGGWIAAQTLLSVFAAPTAGCWGTLLGFSALALLLGTLRGDGSLGVTRGGGPGTLTLEGDVLRVDAGWRNRIGIPLAHIVAGWTEGGAAGERVVLETRTGTLVSVEVPNVFEGQALLEALGLAAEQRAVAMRVGLPPTPGARFVLAFVALLLLAVALPFLLLTAVLFLELLRGTDGHTSSGLFLTGTVALLTGAGGALCLSPLVGTTVRIGTDGVSIHRLGRRRFIPRAELTGVATHASTLVFERRGGDPIVVRAASNDETATLARRVGEALADHAQETPAAALAALDRAGRPIEEWRRALDALLGEAAGYRRAGIAADDLFGVVENGAARPERRVAAAAALVARGGAEARARVRIAAEACVSEKLRLALGHAAEGEIDEDALAAAEAEATRRA